MSAAFLAGALSRNLLVSMASLILALIAVTNLSPNFGAAVPAIALALLAIGVWQTRRQLDRSTAAMKHILEDRESVMKQLDYEIAWRRVGEEYDLEHPEALIKRSCDAMRQASLATSSTGHRSDLGR
jgi:hypothetical protein